MNNNVQDCGSGDEEEMIVLNNKQPSPKAVAVIKCFGTGIEFEGDIHQLTVSKMNYGIFNDPNTMTSEPVNAADDPNPIELDLSKRCFFCQLI